MTATTKAAGAGASTTGLGDAVLDAGAALIEQLGFEGTSLDQIAAKAGTPLDVVLRRYPSRDHVAAAIFDAMLDKMLDDLSEEIEAKSHLEARLIGLLARELRLLSKHKAFAREALRRLLVPFSPAIAVQAPLAARFIAHVAEQIEAARDRREIHRWVIPSVAATAFWALHLQIVGEWLRGRHATHEATLATADRRVRTFVRALGGAPPKARRAHEPTEEAVFRAPAGKTASHTVVLHNTEVDVIETALEPTAFRSTQDRNDRVDPDFELHPDREHIEPGGVAHVHVSVVIPATLTPGVSYRGKLYVPGVESASVAAVLIRLPDLVERSAT